MPILSKNPSTDETVKTFTALTQEEIEKKIEKSWTVYLEWKKTSLESRSALMKKAGALLRAKKDHLAELMAIEMGKPLTAGRGEIEKCAITCEFYADNTATFLTPEKVDTQFKESFVRFDPLGPILAVMPWNFPFWQVIRFAAPALMAGNTGLLKHASNVPQCSLAIEEIFLESGFPEGAFQSLLIDSSQVEKVIENKRIMAITLTGSESAGSKVAATAGKVLKKTVLELGGSDPFIVLEDADLDIAAKTAVQARMQNNAGQSCIAAKRFIVVEKVAQEFTDKLVEAFRKIKIGDPMIAENDIGPLATNQIMETIDEQVKKSVQMGAKLLYGGKRIGTKGNFYEPTILSDVTEGMPASDEETFGPVAAIITVKNTEEAVKEANRSMYGLGASIWTRNIDRAKIIAAEIESGAVYINSLVKSDPRLPFGGVKRSGYGRELSSYGMKEFVNVKTVVVERTT